jgi:putative peptidoglycan lipid II flippase
MNLLRALATVSGMTLLSRILGFARDAIIARVFGAGAATDAFVVAFKLPNLLRRLFAEGAFSQAFVPILAEYRNQRGDADTHVLINRVATMLFAVLMAVAALGVLGAPLVILVVAPGFSATPDKFALTVDLMRIVFPYIVFMSLVALAAGVLNTWSRFMLPAFTPALLNVAMILAAVFAAPWFDPPIIALAWGAFHGRRAATGPAVARPQAPGHAAPLGLGPQGSRRAAHPQADGPRVPWACRYPRSPCILNTVFASFLGTGSVSWLYYADRLMEFPAGLLGVALGTILLPSLAKTHASGNTEDFSALLDWGLRLTLMLTLPASLALAMLAVPLLATMFQYGAFAAADVLRTREALVAYSIGLTGLILVKVLAPGFYARQDIRTPVKIALLTLALTQMMNVAFIGWLKHAGLALSIGLASCVNAVLLWRGLRQRGAYLPKPGWNAFMLKLLAALIVLGIVLWFAAGRDAAWLAMGGGERILRLSGVVLAGLAAYFATLGLLGFRPRDFRRRAA